MLGALRGGHTLRRDETDADYGEASGLGKFPDLGVAISFMAYYESMAG